MLYHDIQFLHIVNFQEAYMDIRTLEYFLVIAREESITAAADILHVSQPALSRQLKELEKELEKKLFVRESRGISLTEDGLLLKKRAEEMVTLMEKTKKELKNTDETLAGDIYIGAGEAESVHYLTEAAYRLKTTCPDICFHISSGDTEDVLDQLNKGLIDFALIVSLPDTRDKKYNYIHLPKEEMWGVLLPEKHPLAEKETIKADDLIPEPLIISNELLHSDILTKITGRPHEHLHISATYSLLYNASIMVKDGLGIAIGLDGIINTRGDSRLVFRPLSPNRTIGMSIVWKKYQILSKTSLAFLNELHKINST